MVAYRETLKPKLKQPQEGFMQRLILSGVLLATLPSARAYASPNEGLSLSAAQLQVAHILAESGRSCLSPSLEFLYKRLFVLQDQKLKSDLELTPLKRDLGQALSYFRFNYAKSPLAGKSDAEIITASRNIDPRREGNLQLEKIDALASANADKERELKAIDELIKTAETQIEVLLQKISRVRSA